MAHGGPLMINTCSPQVSVQRKMAELARKKTTVDNFKAGRLIEIGGCEAVALLMERGEHGVKIG